MPAFESDTFTHSSRASVGVAPKVTFAVPVFVVSVFNDVGVRSKAKLLFARLDVAVFVRADLSLSATSVYVQTNEAPAASVCGKVFDGQESVYTFHVAPEPIVIESCVTEVDTTREPFQAIQGILFGTGG